MLAIVIVLAVVTVLWILARPWLKTRWWMQAFFDFIEPLERWAFKKSETILAGRLLWVGGTVVTVYDALATFAPALDWTPVTNRILADVPADMRGLVVSAALGVLGLLINWLRKRQTLPIEIVELPDRDIPPAVAAAVAKIEDAKAQAVEVVKEAKAEGAV